MRIQESHFLKIAFHEDDEDHIIITEFSFDELKQMKAYCTRGSCNVMAESILKSFGILVEAKIKPQSDEYEIEVEASKENLNYSNYEPNQKLVTGPKKSTNIIESKNGSTK